jgi:hypothetical protein
MRNHHRSGHWTVLSRVAKMDELDERMDEFDRPSSLKSQIWVCRTTSTDTGLTRSRRGRRSPGRGSWPRG